MKNQSIPLPRIFMPPTASSNCFAMQADGNKMKPEISNRDFLICTKSDTLREGDIAIQKKGKEYQCKYYRELKGTPFYEDANKKIFDHKGFKVIGKVNGIFNNERLFA